MKSKIIHRIQSSSYRGRIDSRIKYSSINYVVSTVVKIHKRAENKELNLTSSELMVRRLTEQQ